MSMSRRASDRGKKIRNALIGDIKRQKNNSDTHHFLLEDSNFRAHPPQGRPGYGIQLKTCERSGKVFVRLKNFN